jgi:hypothetical protein
VGSPAPNAQIGQDTYLSNAGNSSYAALETHLRRRFNRGLQFEVSYTWSHAIDNQSDVFEGTTTDPRTGLFALAGFTKELDAKVDRGNADFDQRHNLVSNAIWEIPAPRFANSWLDRLLEHWTISLIGAHRSGFPVTVIANSLFADPQTGLLNNRLDFIGAPGQSYTPSDPVPVAGGVQWLDPTLFRPAVGHVGNVARNAIKGPDFWNYDAAIIREIQASERTHLQFRAEFYNAFNHANLSAPVTTYLLDPTQHTLNPDFGKAFYGLDAGHSRFGALPLGSASRTIQLGLRITF